MPENMAFGQSCFAQVVFVPDNLVETANRIAWHSLRSADASPFSSGSRKAEQPQQYQDQR